MSDEPRESVTIELPRDLRKWLKVQAAERDVSQSEIVRQTLEAERAGRKRGRAK